MESVVVVGKNHHLIKKKIKKTEPAKNYFFSHDASNTHYHY